VIAASRGTTEARAAGAPPQPRERAASIRTLMLGAAPGRSVPMLLDGDAPPAPVGE
jgi:hypothetical protein